MARRPRGRSLSSGRTKNFHFAIWSRSALGHAQRPNIGVLRAHPKEVERPGHEGDHSPQNIVAVISCCIFIYLFILILISFYIQAVQIHSANGVKLLEARRGVLSSTPPYK
jgi:hypothetical protein